MTRFNLARKNMAGNFKNYSIYFFSMIFSVVIYYTFVSLQYTAEIQQAMLSWEKLRSIFNQASLLLILFVALFMLYSNSFFTKQRKKEVGLFALLGMRKRTIGSMLFYENLIMGTMALGIGIVAGNLLSKLFAMILLKLLHASVEVSFRLSVEAVANTVIVFMALILLVSLHAYRLIYRFKLIELFRAEKEGEAAMNTSLSAAGAGLLLVAFSYWIITRPATTTIQIMWNYSFFLISILAGTYLLFRFAVVQLLKAAKSSKALYYRGSNLISVSNLTYRIRTNARLLTMISLLSAVTLTTFSLGYSNYYNYGKVAEQLSPFSYMHRSLGEEFDRQARAIIQGDASHPVVAMLDVPVVPLTADVTALNYLPSGQQPDEVTAHIISASLLNQISDSLGRPETVRLSGREAAVIRPMYTDHSPSDYIGLDVTLDWNNGREEITFVQMLEGRIAAWRFPDVYFVVSDELYGTIALDQQPVVYKAYHVANAHTTEQTTLELHALMPEEAQWTSFYSVYRSRMESAGLDMFLFGFLGLVFLAAVGSMLYFKQLTEAHADHSRYAILRKIGFSRKELRGSIAKQLLFIFGLPLGVGCLHSVMLLHGLSRIQLIQGAVLFPAVTAMAAYVILYAVYYMLTLHTYYRLVDAGDPLA